MERLFRSTNALWQCLILALITLGYWVEMAEELEAASSGARLGKSLLLVLKLVVYPR